MFGMSETGKRFTEARSRYVSPVTAALNEFMPDGVDAAHDRLRLAQLRLAATDRACRDAEDVPAEGSADLRRQVNERRRERDEARTALEDLVDPWRRGLNRAIEVQLEYASELLNEAQFAYCATHSLSEPPAAVRAEVYGGLHLRSERDVLTNGAESVFATLNGR